MGDKFHLAGNPFSCRVQATQDVARLQTPSDKPLGDHIQALGHYLRPVLYTARCLALSCPKIRADKVLSSGAYRAGNLARPRAEQGTCAHSPRSR